MGFSQWFSFTTIVSLLFVVYLYQVITTFYNILYPIALQVDPVSGEKFRALEPMWKMGSKFNVSVYISETSKLTSDAIKVFRKDDLLFNEDLNVHTTFQVNEESIGSKLWSALGNNKSLYTHFSFEKKKQRPLVATSNLVRFKTMHQQKSKRYLVKDWPFLGSFVPFDEPEAVYIPASKSKDIVGYWIPMAHAGMVTDWTQWTLGGSPATVIHYLYYDSRSMKYLPVVNTDLLGLTSEKLIQINATENNQNLELDIEIGRRSLARWQYTRHMEDTLELQKSFGATEKDIDELRHMLTETDPVLLGVTMMVTLFHVLLDVLAFKSDISFWKNAKSTKGLSVKTLMVDLVSQIIITAYLYEENASMLVLVPSTLSIVVQVWKVKKAFSIQGSAATERFDDTATGIMMKVLMPLVAAYAVYSLVYHKHAGFYAWGIGSLASSVYAFGFIMMCPQIFINYKLKSVAHLPWRFFLYKSLNTFIDDLFAFIIRMPTMHRAACFRDDIVFFIYLYQRYIYPVDMTRKHEMAEEEDDSDDTNSKKKIE